MGCSDKIAISCFNIFKLKHHDYVVEIAYGSPDGCLFYVMRMHLDLIVAIESVYKGKYEMTSMTSTVCQC